MVVGNVRLGSLLRSLPCHKPSECSWSFNKPFSVLTPTNDAQFLQYNCLFIVVNKTDKEPPEIALQSKKYTKYDYIQNELVVSHVTTVTIVFTSTIDLPASW